jgi:hypothetical protein
MTSEVTVVSSSESAVPPIFAMDLEASNEVIFHSESQSESTKALRITGLRSFAFIRLV